MVDIIPHPAVFKLCFCSVCTFAHTHVYFKIRSDMFLTRCVMFLQFISLAHLCGAGSGLSVTTNAQNKLTDAIMKTSSFLPREMKGLAENFIIDYITRAVHDVLFGDIKVAHYTSGSKGTAIKCPSDLNCDLSKPCRWRNVDNVQLKFYQTSGHPDSSYLESYTGSKIQPKPPSLMTVGNKGNKSAWLVSDKVTNQPGNGYIQFKFVQLQNVEPCSAETETICSYWVTPLLEITVCQRSVGSGKLRNCSDPFVSSNKHGPFKALIKGPIKEPFEIVFNVSNFELEPGGLAIIDDIVYHTDDSCNGKDTATKQPTNGTNEVAKRLDCSFDRGSTCYYDIRETGGHRGFKLESYQMGNKTKGYLVAKRNESATGNPDIWLISPTFELESDKELQFYRRQNSSSILKVCIDNILHCPWHYTNVVKDWKRERVDLDSKHMKMSSKHKLIFIVRGLKKNSSLAITRIRVAPLYEAEA